MEDFFWKLAIFVDIIHLPVALPVIALASTGKLFGDRYLSGMCLFLIAGTQAAFLGCPLTVLSDWLRSFKDPTYNAFDHSFTHNLYEHVGAYGAIPHITVTTLLYLISFMYLLAWVREDNEFEEVAVTTK